MYKLAIREHRILNKLTQKDLAYRIGISQNYLSEIEKGKYDIRVSFLLSISNALDVCPGYLIRCNMCKCRRNRKRRSKA